MEKKRYESRFFIVILFVILGCSLMTSILDPTNIARNGNTISVTSLSGINQAMVWIGIGLILIGMIIRFFAIITLKKNFSGRLRIRADHNLVTNGIYHWISNNYVKCSWLPSYVPYCTSYPSPNQKWGKYAYRTIWIRIRRIHKAKQETHPIHLLKN